MTRAASLLRVLIAYVLAIGAAWLWLVLGPSTDRLWLDVLIADVVATVVIFGFSRYYRNSSFYDAYWSVIPPLLFAWWWLESPGGTEEPIRNVLAALVMGFWAVRLTANWIKGWTGLDHEDWRYPMLREGVGRGEVLVDFFAIHFFPTLQVFLATIPLYRVATADSVNELGVLDAVAFAVGIGAVVLEWTADRQMAAFAATKTPGQAMEQGLWGWSRHPNYLGEWLFWVSLWLFAIAADPGSWWWTGLGALGMLAMFLFASIPMMERRSLERRPDYQQTIDRIPMLFPRPPAKAEQ